eukprot:2166208-Rhodomonas_salina.2
MATVLEVGKKGESFRAGYVSDTYLACSAAFAVHHTAYTFDTRFTDICMIFSKSVHNNSSSGDVGELGVCMVLLEAMDLAPLSLESYYKLCFSKSPSVKLCAFLVALFTHPVDVSDFHPNLNSNVNFNHFTRVYNSDCLVDPEFVAKLWESEAGVLCPPGYLGVDIMIPALHTFSKSTHLFFVCHGATRAQVRQTSVALCDGGHMWRTLLPSQSSRQKRIAADSCKQEWEMLMALHCYSDNLSASFKRDESIKAEMFHTAIPKIDTATGAPGT